MANVWAQKDISSYFTDWPTKKTGLPQDTNVFLTKPERVEGTISEVSFKSNNGRIACNYFRFILSYMIESGFYPTEDLWL